MSAWDAFIAAVATGAASAARTALNGFEAEASADAKAFIAQAKTDFETWTTQVANGTLAKQDLADFIAADIALAQMTALTQAGIAASDIDRLRDALVDVIVNAAFTAFRPG
jgi:hypothetical protein